MAICKNCGTNFNGKFCPQCGTAAESDKFCVNCGTKNDATAKFCKGCGASLGEVEAILNKPAVSTPASAPVTAGAPYVQNPVVAGAPVQTPVAVVDNFESKFTGGAFARWGVNFVVRLVTILTLGLCYPLMSCWRTRWEVSHTYLNGRKLAFDGKGGQLFGKFILWALLSIITLGLYYIFAGRVNFIKWQTKHTHFEGVEVSDEEDKKSVFTGKAIGLIGVNLLTGFVTIITLTFGAYWAHCYKERWFAKHTVIDGHKLYFDGKAGQYFGKRVLWTFLTIITIGIYSFWLINNSKKWTVKHTRIEDTAGLPFPVGQTPVAATPSGVQYQNGAQPVQITGSNGLAIAGFVLSFFGYFSLIGFVLCIVGLVKAKDYGGKGKGLAIAGIIITVLWIVMMIVVVCVFIIPNIQDFGPYEPDYYPDYPW